MTNINNIITTTISKNDLRVIKNDIYIHQCMKINKRNPVIRNISISEDSNLNSIKIYYQPGFCSSFTSLFVSITV